MNWLGPLLQRRVPTDTHARRALILTMAQQRENVTPLDVSLALGISRAYAGELLSTLRVKGKLVRKGAGRVSRYTLP